MIPSATRHMPCEELAQPQHSKTFVEEICTAEVRETTMIIGDSQIPWRFDAL